LDAGLEDLRDFVELDELTGREKSSFEQADSPLSFDEAF
jgi:hypothetical protein